MPYQQQETNSQAGVWRVPSSVRKTNSFNFKVFVLIVRRNSVCCQSHKLQSQVLYRLATRGQLCGQKSVEIHYTRDIELLQTIFTPKLDPARTNMLLL